MNRLFSLNNVGVNYNSVLEYKPTLLAFQQTIGTVSSNSEHMLMITMHKHLITTADVFFNC